MVKLTVSTIINSKTENTTMIPGNAEIVKCPFCGTEKELMTLISGNTCGAEYWSDNKRIAPMLPSVSPVQKCPECKKYYFEHKHRQGESNHESFERGELTFPEWKEAYMQLMSEGISEKEKLDLCFWLIHSYNDHYYRGRNTLVPTEEDFMFFTEVALSFVENYDWTTVKYPLLKAELYREAGKMKECADVLESIPYDLLQDFERTIYDDIKKRVENIDNKVFKLTL